MSDTLPTQITNAKNTNLYTIANHSIASAGSLAVVTGVALSVLATFVVKGWGRSALYAAGGTLAYTGFVIPTGWFLFTKPSRTKPLNKPQQEVAPTEAVKDVQQEVTRAEDLKDIRQKVSEQVGEFLTSKDLYIEDLEAFLLELENQHVDVLSRLTDASVTRLGQELALSNPESAREDQRLATIDQQDNPEAVGSALESEMKILDAEIEKVEELLSQHGLQPTNEGHRSSELSSEVDRVNQQFATWEGLLREAFKLNPFRHSSTDLPTDVSLYDGLGMVDAAPSHRSQINKIMDWLEKKVAAEAHKCKEEIDEQQLLLEIEQLPRYVRDLPHTSASDQEILRKLIVGRQWAWKKWLPGKTELPKDTQGPGMQEEDKRDVAQARVLKTLLKRLQKEGYEFRPGLKQDLARVMSPMELSGSLKKRWHQGNQRLFAKATPILIEAAAKHFSKFAKQSLSQQKDTNELISLSWMLSELGRALPKGSKEAKRTKALVRGVKDLAGLPDHYQRLKSQV